MDSLLLPAGAGPALEVPPPGPRPGTPRPPEETAAVLLEETSPLRDSADSDGVADNEESSEDDNVDVDDDDNDDDEDDNDGGEGDVEAMTDSRSTGALTPQVEQQEAVEAADAACDIGSELPFPDYNGVVFRCLNQTDYPRFWCLQLISWRWFERISMLVILINCITLGMYQPCEDMDCTTIRCKILDGFDHAIFAFFALEMVIKVIAMGFWGPTAYFGDSWNRLDCFIVLAGSLEYLPSTRDLSLTAIRTIRVLRPLRAINRIPSMRILVMLLLDTLPMLGNVLLLCFFVFFIFGIIGVQLWAGVLRKRCHLVLNETMYPRSAINLTDYYQVNNTGPYNFERDFICSSDASGGMLKCSEIPASVVYEESPSNGEKAAFKSCNGSAVPFADNSPTNDSCVNWNQYYSECRAGDKNPFKGAINFDNIGFAWVAIFQVISLESWVDIMYYVQDAHSFWDWIYFVALIVIGSFFMINLCLVVIATQFSETKKRETERMLQERKRCQSTSTLSSSTEPTSCYHEIIKMITRMCRRLKRRLMRRYRRMRGKNKKKITPEKFISLRRPGRRARVQLEHSGTILESGRATGEGQARAGGGNGAESPCPSQTPSILSNADRDRSNGGATLGLHLLAPPALNPPCASPEPSEGGLSVSNLGSSSFLQVPGSMAASYMESGKSTDSIHSTGDCGAQGSLLLKVPQTQAANSAPRTAVTPTISLLSRRSSWNSSSFHDLYPVGLSKGSAFEMSDKASGKDKSDYLERALSDHDIPAEYEERHQSKPPGVLKIFRLKVKLLVDHNFFQRGILAAILVNTLSMGIEYHNQPEELTNALEYSNLVFSALFMLEMVLKMLAEGIIGYISNGFNVFDGVIVILSMVEIIQGGASGLSVLRTFRLLRILKLVRFMPALRRQLFVMLKTMDNVATFFALLVLFIFIFSILGMSLFGCKFCKRDRTGEKRCDRKNFDTLLWAIVTVFQILTQEDWNTVLYNGMFNTSPWAALYFIALMTFGNYVLFNLLVAILVEGFSSERTDSNDDDELSTGHASDAEVSDKERVEAKKVKSDTNNLAPVALRPPIITHTEATPMPTPQGSPSQVLNMEREISRALAVRKRGPTYHCSNSSIQSIDRSETNSVTARESKLQRAKSSSQSSQEEDRVPVRSGPAFNECNGRSNVPPLIPRSRRGSMCSLRAPRACRLQRQGSASSYVSVSSRGHPLSRQNSFNSHRTITPQNSLGSATLDRSATLKLEELEYFGPEEEDTEADTGKVQCIDYFLSKLPEPKGCFKTREEHALYIFAPTNKLRKLCQFIIAQKWFDNCVLLFIALNCITLAMERPSIPPASAERYFLTMSNYVFTVIFTFEMTFKVIAKGMFIGEHSYLRSGWNVMDGFLVVISLIDILITMAAGSRNRIFGILRVFRLLRTLRPLRVISRAPGLKLVVQTLLSSLRPIGNIVLICCTFFIIFGILGVQLFKGKMFYCDGPNVKDVVNKTDCLNRGNKWKNRKYNFDSLGQALMALFVLSSKDGWVQIMYTGLDAVEVDQQPQENFNQWRLIYFISFLLLVGFFVLNMFVGVVVENFHKCRENQEKEEKARRAAKRARRLEKKRRKLREPPYYASFSPPRLVINKVITSKYFDLIIAGVIGLNVITMAMEYYLMPPALHQCLKLFNYVFTTVFVIEAILKIVALGVTRYIKDRWNQLDIFIVILSIIGIVLEEIEGGKIPINPTIIRVMRVLRIARVLKLLKMAKGIRALLDTVIQALPQVGNLGLLFFLLFFIFAALGVELFGRLECSISFPCVGLGRHAHFKNFGMAFLTLFRIATGDNWNGIMKDTLRENCNKTDNCVSNCCVSPIIAPIYFVVFVLMAQFVLVNVVVAVLMKHLEESHKMMHDDDELDKEAQREFDDEIEERLRQESRSEDEKDDVIDEEGDLVIPVPAVRPLPPAEPRRRSQTVTCAGAESLPFRPVLAARPKMLALRKQPSLDSTDAYIALRPLSHAHLTAFQPLPGARGHPQPPAHAPPPPPFLLGARRCPGRATGRAKLCQSHPTLLYPVSQHFLQEMKAKAKAKAAVAGRQSQGSIATASPASPNSGGVLSPGAAGGLMLGSGLSSASSSTSRVWRRHTKLFILSRANTDEADPPSDHHDADCDAEIARITAAGRSRPRRAVSMDHPNVMVHSRLVPPPTYDECIAPPSSSSSASVTPQPPAWTCHLIAPSPGGATAASPTPSSGAVTPSGSAADRRKRFALSRSPRSRAESVEPLSECKAQSSSSPSSVVASARTSRSPSREVRDTPEEFR